MTEIISVIGLAIAVVLIIILVMKDVPILLTGLLGVLILAVTGGLNLYDAFVTNYMACMPVILENIF